MADLRTRWLGFNLDSPVVMAGSPLSLDADAIARAVDVGLGAVILPSLFEVPQTSAPRLGKNTKPSGFFLDESTPYLKQVERLRKRFDVPIVASLNAVDPTVWGLIARRLEDAGASAIEMNLYEVATSVERSADIVERDQLSAIKSVIDSVKVPVTAKLSIEYSSMLAFVAAIQKLGINGVSVFNRFYQPDINLDTLDVDRTLDLSSSSELPRRLHALAAISASSTSGGDDSPLWLGCTGGAHTATDAAKAIVCGAHVVQMASALLLHGPEHVGEVTRGLSAWMDGKGFTSLDDIRGIVNLKRVKDPAVWTRLNYVRQLGSWEPRPAGQP